jgi:hypothetical protein
MVRQADNSRMTACHIGLEFVTGTKYPQFLMTADERFPNNVPHIGSIAAGESKKLTYVDPVQVWDAERRRDWSSTDVGLHFAGRIIYIDRPGSGISRTMAFRRKYDLETQRFHRLWEVENEHEYSD